MTKPIKFRGRDIRGRILFGDIRHNNGVWFMFDGDFWYEVDSDSIAQLVGVDKDGNEVYEDDLVTDKNGYEGFAALLPVVDDVFVTDVGCCSCFNDKCKLKEARP